MSEQGIVNVAPAAATCTVGYNLLDTEPDLATAKKKREITGMGLAGSTAINDTIVEVRIDGMYTATLRNTTAGAVMALPFNDIIQGLKIDVPANAEITARIIDPPTTNPVNLVIILE